MEAQKQKSSGHSLFVNKSEKMVFNFKQVKGLAISWL